MKDYDELTRLCRLLFEGKVRFWIDSGTLLGLIRDGRILENDDDIDLGMWADDESRLVNLLEQFRESGYKVLKRNYRGMTYRYLCIPKNRDLKYLVDLNLFRNHNHNAWCPLVFPKANPFTRMNPLYYIIGTLRFAINYWFERLKVVNVERFPWTLICKVYTWWIPAKYFSDLSVQSNYLVVPKAYAEYLQLRYGNWRVPCKEWVFYDDDGGIKRDSPEGLME